MNVTPEQAKERLAWQARVRELAPTAASAEELREKAGPAPEGMLYVESIISGAWHVARQPVEDDAPAAKAKVDRKKHKLGDEVPTPLTLYAPAEWRRYPGMPDILIHRDQIAVVQRVSRRRGVYFKTLARRSFKQKDFWRHFKGGKRTLISVKRAMYECGFWQRKTK